MFYLLTENIIRQNTLTFTLNQPSGQNVQMLISFSNRN